MHAKSKVQGIVRYITGEFNLEQSKSFFFFFFKLGVKLKILALSCISSLFYFAKLPLLGWNLFLLPQPTSVLIGLEEWNFRRAIKVCVDCLIQL